MYLNRNIENLEEILRKRAFNTTNFIYLLVPYLRALDVLLKIYVLEFKYLKKGKTHKDFLDYITKVYQ